MLYSFSNRRVMNFTVDNSFQDWVFMLFDSAPSIEWVFHYVQLHCCIVNMCLHSLDSFMELKYARSSVHCVCIWDFDSKSLAAPDLLIHLMFKYTMGVYVRFIVYYCRIWKQNNL